MYATMRPEPILAKENVSKGVDLKKVREAITEVIDTDAEKRGDGTSLAGTFIRLAWHCSGKISFFQPPSWICIKRIK